MSAPAPPAKKFSDTPVRDGQEAERKFDYFTPRKRKASLYEDVTIDTQPSVHRHLHRGWPVSFEDGRGAWSDDSTALACTDWFAFRDPGELWERPFYQDGAAAESAVESAVRSAAREGMFKDLKPEWVEFLRANAQVPAFAEHGLWLATASIGRDCLSDAITHCVVMQCAHKQRLAQSIVLYAMDLETNLGGEFSTAAAKERWLEHPAWQPTREYVERLHSLTDWGEVIVATNVCYEPIVGAIVRRELGIRAATVNGDTITPVLARTGQVEWGWTADWTRELMGLVFDDAEHGTKNREVVAGWIAEWLPRASAAAEALTAIVDELPVGFDIAEGQKRIQQDTAAFHESIGVAELGGVTA